MILSTSDPTVFITRTASDLAFLIGQAVERELVRSACQAAKAAGVGLIEDPDITAVVERIDPGELVRIVQVAINGTHPRRHAG